MITCRDKFSHDNLVFPNDFHPCPLAAFADELAAIYLLSNQLTFMFFRSKL